MRRIVGVGALVLVVGAVGFGLYVYRSIGALEHEQLGPDSYVIYGLGGNVGVLGTGAGTVLVDSMTFPMQGRKIAELAEKLTGEPVTTAINTHHHPDHTHGNPGFADAVTIIATEAARHNMLEFDAAFWEGDAARGLPDETFARERTLEIGEKTIRLLHLGRGHTDGDLVALFVDDGVLHTGDLAWNEYFPNIDLEAGASVRLWLETLENVLALEFERVIPGHGPATDADGVRAFQTYLRDLWQVGRDAAARGLTLEETLAEADLGAYEHYGVIHVPFVLKLDLEFNVKRVWQEATGAVAYTPRPAAATAP